MQLVGQLEGLLKSTRPHLEWCWKNRFIKQKLKVIE